MSAFAELLSIIKSILLLKEKLDHIRKTQASLTTNVNEHEKRLIRLETRVEIGLAQARMHIPKGLPES